MGVCCCSLAGTSACQHCSNNSMAMTADNIPTEAYKNYGRAFIVQNPKPMINADRIRSMTDEELTNFYFDFFFPQCPYCECDPEKPCPEHNDCKICLLEWLKQKCDS